MIDMKVGTIYVSEQTLHELVKAVERAKAEIEFTDEPMGKEDMETQQFVREQARRGQIRIESPSSGISFVIQLPRRDREQESLGYELAGI